jgi:hypothetical protein
MASQHNAGSAADCSNVGGNALAISKSEIIAVRHHDDPLQETGRPMNINLLGR